MDLKQPKQIKLGLGTANFSSHYGIANENGILAFEELSAIVKYAGLCGIKTIDTAEAYGDAEKVLGQLGVTNFDVITKVGLITGNHIKKSIQMHIERTKALLCSQKLYALLLHFPDQILETEGAKLALALNTARDIGLVEKVGISIYGPENLDKIIELFQPDIIQAPFNIFDQRLLNSGWVDKLKSLGVEIHVRSVFLQGLLVMTRKKLPARFDAWENVFDEWFGMQKELKCSAVDLALGFCLSQDWADQIIVGVDSLEHLKKLVEVTAIEVQLPKVFSENFNDDRLISPSSWKNL